MDDRNGLEMSSSTDTKIIRGTTFQGAHYLIAMRYCAVGFGGTAKIYPGSIIHTTPPLEVAIKDFGWIINPTQRELLRRELQAVTELSTLHPSILPSLGTAYIGDRIAIVSPYMPAGNLGEYIKTHPGCNKDKLLRQVAEAVKFLHTKANRVHGDLKCANVLVSALGDALLTDFGLSTLIEKPDSALATWTSIRKMNTTPFAAPELFMGPSDPSEIPRSKTCESDVYAFSMLIVEVVTETAPWKGFNELAIMLNVCTGQRPPRPVRGAFVSMSHAGWALCQHCWQAEPWARPNMQTVLEALTGLDIEPIKLISSPDAVGSIAYMASGLHVVSGSLSGAISIWDVRTGLMLVGPMQGHTSRILCVAASRDGHRIISTSADLTIRLWNTMSGTPIGNPILLREAARSISYSPGGTYFAYGEGNRVYLREASAGAVVWRTWSEHRLPVNIVTFSPDGRLIASGSDDGTVRLWCTATAVHLATLSLQQDKAIHSLAFSPDGARLVAGSLFQSWRIWSVSSSGLGVEQDHVGTDARATTPVAFSSSSVVTAFGAETVSVWNAATGQLLGERPVVHAHTAGPVAFSPDGRSVVSSATGGGFLVLDLFP